MLQFRHGTKVAQPLCFKGVFMKTSHIGKELRIRGHKIGELRLKLLLSAFIPTRKSGCVTEYEDWVIDSLDDQLTQAKKAAAALAAVEAVPVVEEAPPIPPTVEDASLEDIKKMLAAICERLAITL
jgi:hypothetical protein